MNDDSTTADDGLLLATFRLGEAVFGIDAQQIQEVARVGKLTQVRHAPSYVIGIRNLRGHIITVIDLRIRLGLGSVQAGPESRILIVERLGEPIGLLVDLVSETMVLDPSHIQPAPSNVHGVKGRNLRGVFRGGKRLVAILELATVLQSEAEPGPAASTRESRPA
jgi:purine-binding chemotaxis protein CheW